MITCGGNGRQDIEENNGFGNTHQINSGNFKAKALKLAEKVENTFRICSYSVTYLPRVVISML